MIFAHIADCHIGSWREPKLSGLSTEAFLTAVHESIKSDVDLILISGDLFNTSVPGIDKLKAVVAKLKELKDRNIPVYIIAGSHDFSATGKTMLDVLESAGLLVNVVKGKAVDGKLKLEFTEDARTGVKITGMIGKKGTLERTFYEDLDRDALYAEPGEKIFMLHSAITELKSKELAEMDSAPVSFLPKGFDYYAAGHVHEVIEKNMPGYGTIVYPGPLFPNNFKELEKLKHGGFYIVEDWKPRFVPIQLHEVKSINLDCTGMTPEMIEQKLREVAQADFTDCIITLRLHGIIKSGRLSDIKLSEVMKKFYVNGAFFVMKNTVKLKTEEYEEIMVKQESVEETEEALIREHAGQVKVEGLKDEKNLTKDLMTTLSEEKKEGETKTTFEARIIDSMKAMGLI
jgi:DNA repair exonuclease SbcCD nuclease subunit